MVVSGLILALYAWVFFEAVDNVAESLLVSDIAAIAAAIAFVYGGATYLFAPRPLLKFTSIIGYFLIIAMVALLIRDTGYLSSPFIALWTLAALFAAVFGLYGVAAIGGGIAVYIGTLLAADSLTFDAIVLSVLLGLLPLFVGYIAWRAGGIGSTINDEDRSYHELSSELESVSGQSEIVIQAITDGVVSIDSEGKITLFNPAAERMLGWKSTDALGLDYTAALKLLDSHDSPPTDANNPVCQAISTHTQVTSDLFRLQKPDSGKSFIASITTTPIGKPGEGAIIVFRDITRERAEEREKAEFISTASHEMRTPVASIEGYLGLALNPRTAIVDNRARDYITKAQSAATHLGRLFQDLLDVSKADDSRLSNTPRMIDVVSYIHDIVAGQLPAAEAKQITLEYPPMPDLLGTDTSSHYGEESNVTISPVYYVMVDADHLREIVGNLLENGIKYTQAGSVVVNVTADDTHVMITIRDSGIGIPAEDIPHLFQKFYRVDNTETRIVGGTGLGLYLCRKLTEAIGGKIWVESTYKQGSTFHLKLPRVSAENAKEQLTVQASEPPVQPPAPDDPPQTQEVPLPKVAPTPAPVPAPAPQPAIQLAPVPQRPQAAQLVPEPRHETKPQLPQQPSPQPQPAPQPPPPENKPLAQSITIK